MGTSGLPHQKKIMNRSAPAATIVPVLIYEDVDKAIEWLCRAFGLSERLRASGAGGRITHAQLSIGNGDLMIGASGAEFRPPHGEEVSQYVLVHVEDVDQHFEQAKRSGARIVDLFGERLYTVEDLAGRRWTFSESIADIAPEQWAPSEFSSDSEIRALDCAPRFTGKVLKGGN